MVETHQSRRLRFKESYGFTTAAAGLTANRMPLACPRRLSVTSTLGSGRREAKVECRGLRWQKVGRKVGNLRGCTERVGDVTFPPTRQRWETDDQPLPRWGARIGRHFVPKVGCTVREVGREYPRRLRAELGRATPIGQGNSRRVWLSCGCHVTKPTSDLTYTPCRAIAKPYGTNPSITHFRQYRLNHP